MRRGRGAIAPAWALGLGLLALCAGCDFAAPPKKARPASERMVGPGPAPGAQPADDARGAPGTLTAGERQGVGLPDTAADGPLGEEAAPAAAAAEEAQEEEERDYGKELEAQMGSALSCLGTRTDDSPAEVRVSLVAHVMPSGRISRGDVSSAGLSSEEIACLTTRLEHSYLRTPIEDAPRTVTGTLVLTLK